MNQLIRLAFLSGLLAHQTPAQRDRGPVLGSHLVGMVGSATSSSSGALSQYRLYGKKAGFTPVSPPAPNTPDFRFSTLFPDPMQPGGIRNITLDGMSTGRDYIRADSSGRIATTGNQWVAVLYSVRRRTGGTSAGAIAQEEAAADGAGADVFSVVFGAMQATLAAPRRVVDSTELDLFGSAQRGELLDFDVNMAAYELDPMITAQLPTQPFVFFTLTTADANDTAKTPNAWWGGPTGRSGATILYKKWNGTGWTQTAVAFTYTQLGLLATDDIDSLSIEDRSDLAPYTWDIVFSTTQLSTRAPSELMWSRITLGAPLMVAAATYSDSSGVPVADQLDIGDGNADGVCLYDPSFGQPGASNLLEGYITGTPVGPQPGTPYLDLSVWRNCPGGALTHSALITGSPASDFLFHFTVYGVIVSAGVNVPIWETLSLSGVAAGGAPATSHYPLPPAGVYPSLTADVFVQHMVVSINLGVTPFSLTAQSFPVQIRL